MSGAAPSPARLAATPAGIRLGALGMIADGAARNFVIQLRAGRFHGFVVRRGADAFGYVDRCPHMRLPLARTLDDYLTPSGAMIACAWHGALFDIASGACLGGPCTGARLTPWPVVVAEDQLMTGGDPPDPAP